jgi:hypothetical protein
VKVGDMVRSNRPGAPDLAIILEIIDEWNINIMWLDTGEFDGGPKALFEIVSESESR